MSLDADSHGLNARLLKFRSHPEQEDPHSLAEDLIAARRYGDARGVAVSAQTDDQANDARLLVLEGRAWYLDRDLARAQAALVRAAKLDPYCAEAFRWLGEVLLKRGDPTRAERALERALELEPGAVEPERLLTRARQLARHTPDVPAPAEAATQAARAVTTASGGTAAPRTTASGMAAPGRPRGINAPQATGARPAPAAIAPEPPTTHYQRPAAIEDDLAAGARPTPAYVSAPGIAPAPARTSPGTTASGRAASSAGAHKAPTPPAHVTPAPSLRPAPRTLSSPNMYPPYRSLSPVPDSDGPLRSPLPAAPPARTAAESPLGFDAAPPRTPPGAVTAAARSPSSPGSEPASQRRSAPGTTPMPIAELLARESAASDAARTSPGATPAPARTSPGAMPTPARTSPGTTPAPARTSPGAQPAAARVSSSGGVVAAPRAQRTTPGVQAAPPAHLLQDAAPFVDVEIEPGALPAKGKAAPPRDGDGSRAVAVRWDAPSVVATWPSLEELGQDEEAAVDDAPAAPQVDDAWRVERADDAELELPSGPVPQAPADLQVGASAGEPDDPAVLLRVLEAQGVFEPPEAAPPAWTQVAEVPRTGTRLRGALIGVWLTSLVLLAGGYFGWRQWIEIRHERAAQLVVQARAAAFDGDFARLVDAERLLSEARDNHPRSLVVPTAELFVQAQRVLENGSRELSALSASLRRAEQLKADGDKTLSMYFAATRAVLDVYSGAATGAGKGLHEAAAAAAGEPALLYLIGRLEQRLGRESAGPRLQAAAAAAPDLLAAEFALAELAYEQGDGAAAQARLQAILKRRPDHLRARLFQLFLGADTEEPAAALKTLDALAKDTRQEGAPIDRMLWALSRARLLRRTAAPEKAGEALREALAAGTSEPRLLALLATEAQRTQQLGVAQQAASQAVSAAPHAAAYRALLASILLERHEGERAYQLLSDLPEGNATLVLMRARAALAMGESDALRASLAALENEAKEGATGTELSALLLRVRAALDPKAPMLADAKALLRKVPGDPEVLQTVAEVAIALREPRDAVSALDSLVKVSPDNAEAQFLLGRARRMAADAAGAEKAFRRALELAPSHAGALSALGSLLLDSGKYPEADALFSQLATISPLQSRLGRAEALIGLRKLEDAQIQIAGLSESQRNLGSSRETAARLAIALGKPGEALALLRPLVEAEPKKASVLVLQGDALYAAEDVNAAAGAYEAALELDGTLPEALLGRAEVHLRAERPSDAFELLDDAEKALQERLRAPEMRARALTLRGRALVQRNKRDDAEHARDALRAAVKIPNAPAEAFFWLGEVLGGRKTPEAADALKHYLEIEPKGPYAGRARRALGPLL